MSCEECIYGERLENSNNFVCKCTKLDWEEKPNEHYLHILHAEHTCLQCIAKDNCIGLKA